MRTEIREDKQTEIYNKFRRWRLFKLPFEGNMFLNVAFYYGFQWTVYNIVTAELEEADALAHTIRITSNQIQPRIRNLHAKMTKNRPIVDVIPVGYSDQAVYSATLTKKLLEQFRVDHSEDAKNAETIDWTLICGNAFRKIGFDPTEGEQRTIDMEELQEYVGLNPETGLAEYESFFFPKTDEAGNIEEYSYQIGEIFDEVIPPFEIYAPEYVTGMHNVKEIMHVKIMRLSDLKERWGARKLKDVGPDKEINIGSHFQTRLLGMANPESGHSTGISDALLKGEELVYSKELWSAPSKKYPRGRLQIAIGAPNKLVYDEDNPYYEALAAEGILKEQGYIPIIMTKAINCPGRFWDISPIEPARPLQVEYNKCVSEIVQNRVTVGRNKIIAPKIANIDEEEVANIHGQFLQYSGIIAPQVLPAQPLPQQTEREIERNSRDLDTVTGSHEVSRAEVPSGVKSGIAINYLLEQDDTTLAPIIQEYERASEKIAKAKLALAKYFYTEERLLRDANSDDPLEIESFLGSDISTNIRIVPGSALPQSRAAMQAMYLDLWDRNAIVDENGMPDHAKLFQLLRSAVSIEAFSEEEHLDVTRARRENLLLARGEQILPQHWENHLIHIKEHNRFRKSEKFYKLMAEQQEIAQGFDQHVSFHMTMLAPPTATPGAESMLGVGGEGPGQGIGGGPKIGPPRRSPGIADGGIGGMLGGGASNTNPLLGAGR